MKNWFIGPALTILLSLPVQADSIRLATTTSTYNSGLLDHLLSHFRQVSETDIQVLAVGTGKALRLGENGDVDLVMTHAPAAEAEFVATRSPQTTRGLRETQPDESDGGVQDTSGR